MPFETILNLFVKIVLMLSLGFFLRKKRVVTEQLQQGLTELLLKAVMPVTILASANAQVTGGAYQNLLYTGMIALSYYIGALVLSKLVSKPLRLSERGKIAFVNMSVFANTAFIGYPMAKELFGNEGMMYAVIYNMFFQLIFFTYGINSYEGKGKIEWKAFLTNAQTIAMVAAIAVFLSPFRFPAPIESALETVGGMSVPLSMILIGSSLATIKLSSVMKGVYSYLVSTLRLLVYPLIMMLALKWLDIPAVVKSACVLLTALPAGSLNAIYAQKTGSEPEFAVRTVVQTTVLMLVTVPAVILMMNWMLF